MPNKKEPVIGINIATKKRYRFESQEQAAKLLKISPSGISHVLKGEFQQTNGWKFERVK